jgi:hypothetical protein
MVNHQTGFDGNRLACDLCNHRLHFLSPLVRELEDTGYPTTAERRIGLAGGNV